MKLDGTEHVITERDTEAFPARSFTDGSSTVAVRFMHTAQSSAVLGLTIRQARNLAVQLIVAADEAEALGQTD